MSIVSYEVVGANKYSHKDWDCNYEVQLKAHSALLDSFPPIAKYSMS